MRKQPSSAACIRFTSGFGVVSMAAKLDQQIPQVTLEARRPGAGEDFAHDGRRGDDRACLASCGREFARTAQYSCLSDGHGVSGYQGITYQSSLGVSKQLAIEFPLTLTLSPEERE